MASVRRPQGSWTRCLLWTLRTSSLLALLLLPLKAAAAATAPQIVVEITPEARTRINSRDTRRLMQLELLDTKIAPHPDHPDELALFFRLVLLPEGDLRVELWELGEFHGARRIRAAHGDKKLLARHIALATAELAQRLSRAHTQRAKELAQQAVVERSARRERAEKAKRERWALLSQGAAALLPRSDGWLAGPRLGFQLNHPKGGRLDASASWLFGEPSFESATTRLEWLELRLAPALRFDAYDLAGGFEFAAASLWFTGPVSVDDIANQRQTWSARAGLQLEYQPRIADSLRLHVGAEASVLLRKVPWQIGEHAEREIGGSWLGLSLGVVLEP